MNTAQIFRAAAATVREGWWQYGNGLTKDGECATSAIAKVTQTVMTDRALLPVYAVLVRALGMRSVWDVHQWNDKPEQTAENVAAGLEYAAVIFEQEEMEKANGRVPEQSRTEASIA